MSQPKINSSPLVSYTLLDGDIHQFVFHESSSQALDQWFDAVTKIYGVVDSSATVRMILDVRESGVQPLAYGFNRMRKWMQETPVHPKARVAIVHGGDFLISMFSSLAEMMRLGHLTMKIFTAEHQDQVSAWLMGDG